VQNKLEALIDKHMESIGASKVSLSTITTEALWEQSGRYSTNSELLRIKDRKESGFLLSPTHEEEITALVASMVHSYKELPLRLYQVGRKYRDERRPRGGLLRAKEFMMKDLYTFDMTPEAALETYKSVRAAYTAIFDALKLPYLVADADSGNMGGKLSHEYHFVSTKGEDNIWSCDTCTYIANEELVTKRPTEVDENDDTFPLLFRGISTDRSTEICIYVPRNSAVSEDDEPGWSSVTSHVNLHAVKRALPSSITLDTGIEAATLTSLLSTSPPSKSIFIFDPTLEPDDQDLPSTSSSSVISTEDLTPTLPSSPCPKCSDGKLRTNKAIEVAHTFHLGTRYSIPFNALVSSPDAKGRVPMHMGCHGIGISRLIGSIASLLSTPTGLKWPKAIAPWEVVVLSNAERQGEEMYDVLKEAGCDVVLDDRAGRGMGWKLNDADLIGYPVAVVVGRGWENGMVEVQCGMLGEKKEVRIEEVRDAVVELLGRL
jgi:prolyl-tRNA synthetase